MSEYQYFEFAAIDGPISDEGLRYAQGCSSRANVSRVRWQNTYTFGDFHGSVGTLLKYYDAHFYIANWGTVRLALAFPKGAIAPETIHPYLRGGERYEDKSDRIPISAVLERLSVSEMRALLVRVAEGGGTRVTTELNRLTYPRVQIPAGQEMRCTDFAAKTIEARKLRQKKESDAAAAKRRHEAEQRKQHLASIIQRADTIWSGLDSLMDQKIASAYDQAAAQLQELRDAYAQAGDSGIFERKLAEFRHRYSNRPAMLRRIEKL